MLQWLKTKTVDLNESIKSHKWTTISGLFLIVALLIIHLCLVSKTFFIDNLGSIHSAYESWGDIIFHITQINKFAYEPNFNLNETIFFGEKMHYPFLINLVSGLLLRLTGFVTFSVMFPVYFLMIANLVLITLIYNKLFKNILLTAVAICIFMLGSGVGAFTYMNKALIDHKPSIQIKEDILNKKIPTINYFAAQYPNQHIVFGAPMVLVLMHQRTSFLGLFGFLLFLYLLIQFESYSLLSLKKAIGLGVIYGLLPMIHTHSFVAASLVLAVYGVILIVKKHWVNFKNLLIITGTGFVLAIPQLWYLVGTKSIFTNVSQFAKFRLGWMINPTIGSVQFPIGETPSIFSLSYLNFLSSNFGFILFAFVLAGIYFIIRRKKIKTDNILPILFFLSSIILFLIVQIIQFQPWDYDNNKVLVYYQFFAVPFTLWLIFIMFKKYKKIMVVLIPVYFFITTFSSFIYIIPRLMTARTDMPIAFDLPANHLASYIRLNIPNQIILTSAVIPNPVSLAGRGVLVGYPGWLWSRGINYSGREKEIRNFYINPDKNNEILQIYQIGYILLDNMAINEYGAKKEVFNKLYNKIFEEGQYILYSY
ncbi:MAG: hypothetical protein WCW65_01140 [Candidatus Paceibacterota bacterium]